MGGGVGLRVVDSSLRHECLDQLQTLGVQHEEEGRRQNGLPDLAVDACVESTEALLLPHPADALPARGVLRRRVLALRLRLHGRLCHDVGVRAERGQCLGHGAEEEDLQPAEVAGLRLLPRAVQNRQLLEGGVLDGGVADQHQGRTEPLEQPRKTLLLVQLAELRHHALLTARLDLPRRHHPDRVRQRRTHGAGKARAHGRVRHALVHPRRTRRDPACKRVEVVVHRLDDQLAEQGGAEPAVQPLPPVALLQNGGDDGGGGVLGGGGGGGGRDLLRGVGTRGGAALAVFAGAEAVGGGRGAGTHGRARARGERVGVRLRRSLRLRSATLMHLHEGADALQRVGEGEGRASADGAGHGLHRRRVLRCTHCFGSRRGREKRE
eukprot:Rhum_TRINITY_DN14837_c1_g2::Rhum_TRINITY_DN14837_c1_g2_i1::g.120276::m.120276